MIPEGQTPYLLLVLLFLVLSAFFSSSEAAFLSLQRTRIAHLASTGVPGARRVSRMVEHPERLLSTVLLGNNLVNVAFAALITVITVSLLGEARARWGVPLATAVATISLLVVGEVVPKALAVRHAERLAFAYSRPLGWVETGLWPFVVVLHALTRVVLGRGTSMRLHSSVTEGEIRSLIDIGEAQGVVEQSEAKMLGKVFRFGDRQVRELMTPRTEVAFVPWGATLREFLAIYAEHTHTRFPVFRETPDDIVGILSAKDILRTMAEGTLPGDGPVADMVRDAYFVPETKRVAELFDEMRTTGDQMGIAVDEFGGVAGLVTLKRLVEEVVGRVGEEGAGPEEEFEAIDEHTFRVEGGMSIEEVNAQLDVNLPKGDFETIAGFLLEALGRIPSVGEHVHFQDLTLEVVEMQGVKIEAVRVTREPGARGVSSG